MSYLESGYDVLIGEIIDDLICEWKLMIECVLNIVEINVIWIKLLKIDIYDIKLYISYMFYLKRKKKLDLLFLCVCYKFM